MRLLFSSLLLGAGLCSAALHAQVNITSISTQTTDTADYTAANGVTYKDTTVAVKSFTGGTTTYYATSIANAAYVRRAGTTSTSNSNTVNTSSAWYEQAGSNTTLLGTSATTYSSLLLSNDLTRGSDNTFANTSASDSGNIERLDFVFTGGIKATSDLSFAVFERGLSTLHDAFSIAVITKWNTATNSPAAYTKLTAVNSGWGTTYLVQPFTYDLLRYTTNNDLSTPTSYTQTDNQGIGGIYFTLAQLGVTTGSTIYGYSLFGYDVSASADLTKYSNFSLSTDNQTTGGGIDLAAVNGVLFSSAPIPEPSTYALFGAGSLAALAFWRRRRRAS